MFNVQQVNTTQPPDWNPSAEELRRVKQAVVNEAYPPASRTGVGPVGRRVAR